ncbi:MAG: T9SS type A sorting domain-containing protein [Chitinophagaceae bacterium]|nr:T9SS type A sorting domain-containing protein [Chitinophagaceae bacterium]
MLEFTVGEVASKTLGDGNNLLTRVFYNPYYWQCIACNRPGVLCKRINNTTVQLDWKTVQEINNKGFHIERKKENEGAFNAVDFVNSKARHWRQQQFAIEYQKMDNNNFAGIPYYRIKQEDIDGRTAYSIIRIVKSDVSKQLTMQVWPVPAVGFFNVSVSGLNKTDMIQVLDMSGRLVKQFAIQNNAQQQVSGLPGGTYYIKLASDKTVGQKVIVL